MNNKRQTIWLVSMLSLMVVLSAYYLFTEDVNKLNLTTDSLQQDNVKVANETVNPNGQTSDKAVNGVSQDSSAKNDKNAANAKPTDAKATDKAASADAEVLNKIQNQGKSGEDFFAASQLKRDEELQKQTDKYINIISDPKQSPDELVKAKSALEQLETKQAKVEGIEDKLAKDFKNVIVQEEDGKFKVVVQAEKLEKSEAVSIFDLVIKELNVTQDKINVVVQH